MLKQAEDFDHAASLLATRALNGPEPEAIYIALSAFAYELALKALYFASTGKRWPGNVFHDLAALYELLDTAAQTEIAMAWKPPGGGVPTRAAFLTELKEVRHTFVDGRYLFEAVHPVRQSSVFATVPRIAALVRERVAGGHVLFNPDPNKKKFPKIKQPSAVPDERKVLAQLLAVEQAAGIDLLHDIRACSAQVSLWAFAYELALKCLYVASERKRWPPKAGHRLTDMYSLLRRDVRDEIVGAWIERRRRSRADRELVWKVAGGDSKHFVEAPLNEAGFLQELSRGDDAFQDWRYVFDSTPTMGDFVQTMPRIKGMIRALIATAGRSFLPPI